MFEPMDVLRVSQFSFLQHYLIPSSESLRAGMLKVIQIIQLAHGWISNLTSS